MHRGAVGPLPDADLAGDPTAQVADVADDPHRATAVTQVVQHRHHLLEAVVVKAAEALVDEEGLQVESPDSSRTASASPSARASDAMNDSPPESVEVSRA